MGYDVEVFKRVAEALALTGSLEWAPGNWTWKCLPAWDQTLNEVMKAQGPRQCDLMVAGVSATPQRILAGVRFTHPTLASGRHIMVHINMDRGMWSFLEPFTPSLWLAACGTSAFVGLVLLLTETRAWAMWRVPRPATQRAMGLQWCTLTVLLRAASQLSPRTTAGRLVLAGWGFMAFILANLYISSMAAILATRSQQVNVQSIADLVTQPVGIFVDDQAAFQKFALKDVRYLPWSTDQDEAEMLRLLRSGAIKALVLDSPWVRHTAAANCDLFIVGERVLPINLAFAFPTEVPESYLTIFDSVLTSLDDTGVLAQLERQWMTPTKPCHSPHSSFKDVLSPVVELDDVAGLWVMLAACIGAALVWNLAKQLWGWVMHRWWVPPPGRQQQQQQRFQHHSASNSSRNSVPGLLSKGVAGGGRGLMVGVDGGVSDPLGMDPTTVMGSPPTHDEALQAMERQLAQVDHLVRSTPFVMAAIMDARLSELRGQLVSIFSAQQLNPSHAGAHVSHQHTGSRGEHAQGLQRAATGASLTAATGPGFSLPTLAQASR